MGSPLLVLRLVIPPSPPVDWTMSPCWLVPGLCLDGWSVIGRRNEARRGNVEITRGAEGVVEKHGLGHLNEGSITTNDLNRQIKILNLSHATFYT